MPRSEEQKLTIADLLQRAFARRSERYIHDPNQLVLDFGAEAQDAADGLAEAAQEAGQQVVKEHLRRKNKRKKPRSEKLPEHLPRYEVEAEVAEELKNCPAHGQRKVIGYDTVETLEFERPKLKVRVTKYQNWLAPRLPNNDVEQWMKTSTPQGGSKDRLFDRGNYCKSQYFRTFTGCPMAA